MWQLILMIIAVFLLVAGVLSVLKKLLNKAIELRSHTTNDEKTTIVRKLNRVNFWSECFMIAVGLSYLIWYCN